MDPNSCARTMTLVQIAAERFTADFVVDVVLKCSGKAHYLGPC
jgi:hypothetical protein